VKELRGAGERIRLVAADAGTAWTVTLGPDGFSWDHSTEQPADVSLRGDGADLYLLMWGRRKPDDASRFGVEGQRALLDFWIERSSL